MNKLPAYLSGISHIAVDKAVENSSMTRRVREKLPHLPVHVLNADDASWSRPGTLYLKNYKGRFLRFCPGTSQYRCCGYRIIHIGENCPLRCSYCILQAYFQDNVLKVWANQNDLWSELEYSFAGTDKRFRVGTGEFTDSLVLEALTGYSRDLVDFLGGYPNVCLELKSKVVNLDWIAAAKRPDRVLPAWSVNAPQIVKSEEQGVCATLEERLHAARTCAELGFRVCLHFDPIICFPGWQKGYAETIEMIFDYLRPENIAYMSLGSFRFMPELKEVIQDNFPASSYIYNEFISGLDGKQRLLRPLRLEQFSFLVNKLRKKGMERQLYFCMESDAVWKDIFGYRPSDLGGLALHLLRQAFGD